jgi:hypothetical protein
MFGFGNDQASLEGLVVLLQIIFFSKKEKRMKQRKETDRPCLGREGRAITEAEHEGCDDSTSSPCDVHLNEGTEK